MTNDVFADLFGAIKQSEKVSKPMPVIRGKRFDGTLYVNAADVAAALQSQAPEANARLIAKLTAAAGAQ